MLLSQRGEGSPAQGTERVGQRLPPLPLPGASSSQPKEAGGVPPRASQCPPARCWPRGHLPPGAGRGNTAPGCCPDTHLRALGTHSPLGTAEDRRPPASAAAELPVLSVLPPPPADPGRTSAWGAPRGSWGRVPWLPVQSGGRRGQGLAQVLADQGAPRAPTGRGRSLTPVAAPSRPPEECAPSRPGPGAVSSVSLTPSLPPTPVTVGDRTPAVPHLRLSLAIPTLSLPYSLHLPSLPLQGPGTPVGTWLPSAQGAGLRQGPPPHLRPGE